jgi:hypothetical protein
MDGQPFMVLNKAVDPGMIKVIENDILPQLEKNLPDFVSGVLCINAIFFA